MEKTPRIQIGDLPASQTITREEMQMITGGWQSYIFGLGAFGSIPGKSSLSGDFSNYFINANTGEVTYY